MLSWKAWSWIHVGCSGTATVPTWEIRISSGTGASLDASYWTRLSARQEAKGQGEFDIQEKWLRWCAARERSSGAGRAFGFRFCAYDGERSAFKRVDFKAFPDWPLPQQKSSNTLEGTSSHAGKFRSWRERNLASFQSTQNPTSSAKTDKDLKSEPLLNNPSMKESSKTDADISSRQFIEYPNSLETEFALP